jgi:hypothetical protein
MRTHTPPSQPNRNNNNVKKKKKKKKARAVDVGQETLTNANHGYGCLEKWEEN